MIFKNFLTLLTFLAVSFSAQIFATNYYVSTSGNNNNNGSSISPWRTIQYAVDQSNGGDTIYVYDGTYQEQIIFSGSNDSGSNGSLLTLTAVSGENPIIDGSNLTPNGRAGLITINNSSYIKISGFTIQNYIASSSNQNATPCGFYMDGSCTQVEFSSNTISNIKHESTCTDPCGVGAHGIGIFGTTTNGITDVVFDSNEVYGNTLQASEAFVINGNVSDFTQTNNYVHDNNNIGFDYIGFEGECRNCGDNDRARNGIVRGNRAINNRSDLANPWYDGDASAGGFYVDGGADILFEGNISSGNNMGFELASEHEGRNTENIIVRNNYIYNNSEVGISMGGSEASAAAVNVSLINNTFYKNHGWGSEIVFQSYVQNASIMNNIFYADNTDAFETYNPSTNSNNTWSNNLYYNGAAAGGSISKANPRLADPANGDLDLTSSSPAIGIGTNSATNIGTTDIKGNARIYNGNVDLGAHEYGSGDTNTTNTLTTSSLSQFDANGASQTITISSNINWTVSENSSWFSVDKINGSDNGSVTVTTNQNTSTNDRSSSITISGSGINRTISISQTGADDTSNTHTSIPALIQAEDYDMQSGTKTENTQDNNGGENVGFIDIGDSLTYDINVPSSGNYSIDFRVASRSDGTSFNIFSGNTNIGSISSEATGGWQTWETVSEIVSLNEGDQTIRLVATGSGWNINWLNFSNQLFNASDNLALNGNASQSTTAFNGNASRAIDGNSNGIYSLASVTHTAAVTGSWWQVQLNAQTNIGNITIYNRTDSCCTNRLSNFTVTVINNNGNNVFSQTITQTPIPSITINAGNVLGNTIRIFNNLTNTPLSLAEVEVYPGEANQNRISNTNLTSNNSSSENFELTNEVSKVLAQEITLYPNPFNDIISIKLSENMNVPVTKLKILNSVGKVVLNENIGTIDTSIEINSNFNSGLYFIQLLGTDNEIIAIKKAIKK